MKKFNKSTVEQSHRERPLVFCFIITLLPTRTHLWGSMPPFLSKRLVVRNIQISLTASTLWTLWHRSVILQLLSVVSKVLKGVVRKRLTP